MPPSRRTLWNRQQDAARLRELAGDALMIRFTPERSGYTVHLPLPDGRVLYGPARHEVIYAFIVGYLRGLGGAQP